MEKVISGTYDILLVSMWGKSLTVENGEDVKGIIAAALEMVQELNMSLTVKQWELAGMV